MNARWPAGMTGVAAAGAVVLGALAAAAPVAATTPPPSTAGTTTTLGSSTSTTASTTTSTTIVTTPPTSGPLDAVTATLTAGCSNGVGFVDAEVSTSVALDDVRLELFRMFHDPQPFDSVAIGDMAAGASFSTRFLVDGGFTYSIDVIAGTEFVAGAVDGMNPCVSPAAPPAPAAAPTNTLPSTL